MKVGEVWKSKLSESKFTVDAVSKSEVQVSVERRYKGTIDIRKKTLSPEEFSQFARSYEHTKEKT